MSENIIVISKAGRDKGRMFLILSACDDESVLIADGLARTVSKPKKKKLKHLEILTKQSKDQIKDLLHSKKVLTDSEIIKEIAGAKTYFQTGGDNSVKR